MTPRDHDSPGGAGGHAGASGGAADSASDSRAAGGTGSGSDPLRDLFLGLAGQIDQLASLFAGGPRTATASGADADGVAGQRSDLLKEAVGELTSLMGELGDLLARLLAALIAVLEALVRALQSTSAAAPHPGAAPPRYQAIEVRFESPAQPTTGTPAPGSRPEEGELQ